MDDSLYSTRPILITRFILNLRHTADRTFRGSTVEEENPSQVASRMRFRLPTLTMETIIGPIGEPLEMGRRDIWEEEQDRLLDGASQNGTEHPLTAEARV